ncbi:MAG: aminotransferase class V-fold PLP-dependent enzyme [Patescibacteria group bacterium]|nr:aminotransferase class V-fold PLP-dependent enzyme [Patescibacteria group bacterium]
MFWRKKRTYLDVAAGVSGNPSSPHEEGRKAKRMLKDARTTIARLVEVQPDDVIFTSGATESNALAILGHVMALKKAGKKDIHILYLPSAHASIIENAKSLQAYGVTVEELPIKEYRVDTAALAKMLRAETALVSMDAVCGETGVVWNTHEVAHLLQSHVGHTMSHMGGRALVHVDASQAPLTEKITRAHFGADMLTFDASKVSATRGIGALIAHRTIPIAPLYGGGGQERGLRSGSEAPELAQAFAAALRAAAAARDAFCASAEQDRAFLTQAIYRIPDCHVQEGRFQASHILNISLPGRDTDYLVALLDEAGFAVSSRSACETDSEEGSRAVFALTGDPERARSTLRISWGPGLRRSELRRFSEALIRAVAFIDNSKQR